MIEGLNEQQSCAALAVEGPVIVFAGAGSGKTRTLTFRIAHMICDCHISPYNILAITFTNKATNEMRERLKRYQDIDIKAITISTFHSLCAMILRREIQIIGYGKDFTIVDEEDQLKIIQDVLKENGGEKNQARGLQKSFNYNKCFMTKPDNPFEQELFDKYEEKMKELNMLDFEDLLLKVYQIFGTCPEILFKYQSKFKYILIDEFQDTNTVQYEIARMLAIKNHNIFVVGDDDQSIYSFRGTNYENMNRFREDFPEYQLFTLTENYRSTQAILDVCNRLIANNKNRQEKDMVTTNTGSIDDVITYTAQSENDEVDFICQNISALKSSSNSYMDFAILYRSSVLLRNIELGLIRMGYPYKVYGGVSYLRRKEVKDIVAYFKLMLNPNDIVSFKRIVNTPTRGIGIATVDKIEKIKKIYKLDIYEAIDWSESLLPDKKFADLDNFKQMIKKYAERLKTDNLLDIFDDLVNEIDYNNYLKSEYEKNDALERLENLKEFKSILYTIETVEPDRDKFEKIKEAFDDAVLSDDYLQNQKENKFGITVSTIHSVKGLEFSYVFIVGLEEDLFPNNSRLRSDAEVEEERRIAYVGMTRAKKKLFLTLAKKRLLYGHFYNNEPSRFLLEAIGASNLDKFEDIEPVKEVLTLENKKVIERRDTSLDGDYQISDIVIHKVFGEGIILGIDNGIGNIFFKEEKATKKILLSHPSLSKKR